MLLVVGQRLAQDVYDYPRLKKRLYCNGNELDLFHMDQIQNRSQP